MTDLYIAHCPVHSHPKTTRIILDFRSHKNAQNPLVMSTGSSYTHADGAERATTSGRREAVPHLQPTGPPRCIPCPEGPPPCTCSSLPHRWFTFNLSTTAQFQAPRSNPLFLGQTHPKKWARSRPIQPSAGPRAKSLIRNAVFVMSRVVDRRHGSEGMAATWDVRWATAVNICWRQETLRLCCARCFEYFRLFRVE